MSAVKTQSFAATLAASASCTLSEVWTGQVTELVDQLARALVVNTPRKHSPLPFKKSALVTVRGGRGL